MSSSTLAVKLIDDVATLTDFLSVLLARPTNPTSLPTLYLDLEGKELSRTRTISLLTIHHTPTSATYLIDITTLSDSAFSTPAPTPNTTQTLKSILEEVSIPKVFFDVRNDSDALFSHFKISLKGIIDLQLLELGSRSGPLYQKRHVRRRQEDRKPYVRSRERRSYAVFDARPLKEEMVVYCVQDVTFLPALLSVYTRKFANRGKAMGEWKGKIERAILERVRDSQTAGY
ncbi:uncharacterized protein PAC_03648 [Phialocephala subalpina]|uniref:3'-5' exonuclease domain-containing protein n=1 Tax=Phialocephala subalpina TaxID=576137 RepID=A0A1L7WLX5_9HELO|nr:uncharacterized protein PAC_03648 [Phialocephala subalpina]